MGWLREIKKVGLPNWVWFVVWLRRNEFSNKLCLSRYYPNLNKLVDARNKAHHIDKALREEPHHD